MEGFETIARMNLFARYVLVQNLRDCAGKISRGMTNISETTNLFITPKQTDFVEKTRPILTRRHT
jgi:hypothetical protein